jgi:hypothetical protein
MDVLTTGHGLGGDRPRSVSDPSIKSCISCSPCSCQQGLLTLQRKRTGGNQHVTVKHIHQQVNVTEGGQAVVAGDKVMSRTRGRRFGNDGGGMVKNER